MLITYYCLHGYKHGNKHAFRNLNRTQTDLHLCLLNVRKTHLFTLHANRYSASSFPRSGTLSSCPTNLGEIEATLLAG